VFNIQFFELVFLKNKISKNNIIKVKRIVAHKYATPVIGKELQQRDVVILLTMYFELIKNATSFEGSTKEVSVSF
jgi:hypothetical protein